jgi:hypothetical protein
MSEREESQMQQGVAPPATTSAAAPAGNRPAQNARQVASQNQIDEDWRGGEDATDFLGLDLEVAPGSTPEAMLAPSPVLVEDAGADAPPAEQADSESWLLSLDDKRAGQAGHEPVADTAEESTETFEGDEDPLVAPPLEASWTDTEAPRRARRKRVLAAVCGVLIVGAAAALYQWKTRPDGAIEEPLIAQLPTPHSTPHTSATKPDAGSKSPTPEHADAQPSDASSTTASSTDAHAPDSASSPSEASLHSADASLHSADASALATDATTSAPDADAHTAPAIADAVPPVTASSTEPDSALHADAEIPANTHPASDVIASWLRAHGDASSESGLPSPLGAAPFASEALPAALDRAPNYGMSRSPSENPGAPTVGREGTTPLSLKGKFGVKTAPPPNSKLRHATESDLAGIWEGSVIPMDSIGAPSRLLTPGVGRVRVVIQRGEVFEGVLYAVGQNRVWLDTDLGRLALLSDQLQRIEHLSSTGGTPGLGARGSQDLAGLPRVRVRTPGGTFYGKVIARDDGTVTLITDEGARILLETKDVEAAPLGSRTVVVKPPAKR